jgi:hypothetical protein
MRLSFQIILAMLIGLGTLYVGALNIYSPISVFEKFYKLDVSGFDQTLRLVIETQVRLLSGMWIAAGVAVLFAVRNFEKHVGVLRLVLAGLSLGAIGELLSVQALGGDISAAAIKCGSQISICLGIECWRLFLEKRQQT